MKIAWVLGWAIPGEWFAEEAKRFWPGTEHVCVPATPEWKTRLEALRDCDALGGYSLGALLLLGERAWVAERWARVDLLAPIWAFPSEAGRGGRVETARVRALRRWLRRDEASARADFYARSGLDGVGGAVEPADVLGWGLEQLTTRVAEPGLPTGWRAFAGAEDALLDAATLARETPGLRVVPGAGHAPGPLLAAACAGAEVAA